MSLFSQNRDSPSLGAIVAESLGVVIVSYPMLLLKTRRQVSSAQYSYRNMCSVIMRYEGFRGFYKGSGICLLGFISGKAIVPPVKRKFSNSSNTNSVEHDLPKKNMNATEFIACLIAIHLIRIPCEVVSQRLMVQVNVGAKSIFAYINNSNSENYKNGFDVFRKIMRCDGPRGLYRGFGISILTKLISAAIWIPSFNYVVKKLDGGRRKDEGNTTTNGVHICLSGFVASGLTAIVTTPLDTITTRLQVLDAVEENGRRRPLTFKRTVRNLVNEGGILACYRGFQPKWASMFMSFGAMYSYNSLSKRRSTETN